MKTLDLDAPKLNEYYISKMIRDLKNHKQWLLQIEELLRLRIAAEIADDARHGFNEAVFTIFYESGLSSDGKRKSYAFEQVHADVSVLTQPDGDRCEIVFATGE